MSEHERENAERGRVEAETERVVAEGERVDAEAGTGGHALEESRVKAEHGRVEAEDRRAEADAERGDAESTLYRRVTTLWAMRFGFIVVLPLLIVIVLLIREDRQSDRTAEKLERTIERLEKEIEERCDDARINRLAIRETVIDGLSNLGYRYDADSNRIVPHGKPLVYFREQPAERDALIADSRRTLARFPPIECNDGGGQDG